MSEREKAERLRERLLGLDPQESEFHQQYGAGLQSTFDRQLSGPSRLRYGAVGAAGLLGCLVSGSLALTEPGTVPMAVRGLLALFAFFGLSWTMLATWVLLRGRDHLLVQRTVAARMAFGFTLITVIALALVIFVLERGAVGTPMLATGLALLILAAVVLADVRIERSELAIREQILRLEGRLMEMVEAARRPDGERPGPA